MNTKKAKLFSFYQKNRRMPSYAELMSLFGYQSKNSAYKLAQKLIRTGLVEKDSQGKLLPTNQLLGNIKILGTVEAGFPSPAEEELSDTMTLDEFLISNREATYVLRVSGDSMKDAGIIDGDMVLVDRSISPKDGDIVIADVDGNWTMKYFRKKGKKIYLQAANKKYKDIYPKDDLSVSAVVQSVIRKY
jgi:SOS regulatory protein LexA